MAYNNRYFRRVVRADFAMKFFVKALHAYKNMGHYVYLYLKYPVLSCYCGKRKVPYHVELHTDGPRPFEHPYSDYPRHANYVPKWVLSQSPHARHKTYRVPKPMQVQLLRKACREYDLEAVNKTPQTVADLTRLLVELRGL